MKGKLGEKAEGHILGESKPRAFLSKNVGFFVLYYSVLYKYFFNILVRRQSITSNVFKVV